MQKQSSSRSRTSPSKKAGCFLSTSIPPVTCPELYHHHRLFTSKLQHPNKILAFPQYQASSTIECFATGTSHMARCYFFNKPEGCRNGNRCRFLHISAATQPSTHPVASSSTVKSEVAMSEKQKSPQIPAIPNALVSSTAPQVATQDVTASTPPNLTSAPSPALASGFDQAPEIPTMQSDSHTEGEAADATAQAQAKSTPTDSTSNSLVSDTSTSGQPEKLTSTAPVTPIASKSSNPFSGITTFTPQYSPPRPVTQSAFYRFLGSPLPAIPQAFSAQTLQFGQPAALSALTAATSKSRTIPPSQPLKSIDGSSTFTVPTTGGSSLTPNSILSTSFKATPSVSVTDSSPTQSSTVSGTPQNRETSASSQSKPHSTWSRPIDGRNWHLSAPKASGTVDTVSAGPASHFQTSSQPWQVNGTKVWFNLSGTKEGTDTNTYVTFHHICSNQCFLDASTEELRLVDYTKFPGSGNVPNGATQPSSSGFNHNAAGNNDLTSPLAKAKSLLQSLTQGTPPSIRFPIPSATSKRPASPDFEQNMMQPRKLRLVNGVVVSEPIHTGTHRQAQPSSRNVVQQGTFVLTHSTSWPANKVNDVHSLKLFANVKDANAAAWGLFGGSHHEAMGKHGVHEVGKRGLSQGGVIWEEGGDGGVMLRVAVENGGMAMAVVKRYEVR